MGGGLKTTPLGIWLNGNAPMSDFNFLKRCQIKVRSNTMNRSIRYFLFLFVLFGLVGCGGPMMTLLDVKATSDKLTPDKAYNMITSVLVDKGLDVKVANKDIGLITTEYKQFGSVDGNPPFDFYLQIKSQVTTRSDGKLQIKLTPQVKEVNRINSSAFTERELVFLSDEDQKGYLNSIKETNLKGQLLFMNVVQGVSEALGVGMEQLEYNKKLSDK